MHILKKQQHDVLKQVKKTISSKYFINNFTTPPSKRSSKLQAHKEWYNDINDFWRVENYNDRNQPSFINDLYLTYNGTHVIYIFDLAWVMQNSVS